MGHVRMGIPEHLATRLAGACGARTFIETGTYHGGSAAWAAGQFDRVHTIEICPKMSARARERLSHLANIEFHCGNSADVLPMVAASLSGPALFWLDGHYSGPGTGGVEKQCPVLAELEAISRAQEPVILIDDARCFLGPPPAPLRADDWPSLGRIIITIERLFPGFYTTIRDDVIIAVPSRLRPVLDEEWRTMYPLRHPQTSPSLFARMKSRLKEAALALKPR